MTFEILTSHYLYSVLCLRSKLDEYINKQVQLCYDISGLLYVNISSTAYNTCQRCCLGDDESLTKQISNGQICQRCIAKRSRDESESYEGNCFFDEERGAKYLPN